MSLMFPILYFGFYLLILGLVCFMIYSWVNKFIVLKTEQNELLREIVKRMDKRAL
ncbi:hypothetical protein Cycma_1759 [Cyclobacterium marinum DSM 745]|uniref:Uncharacterized protein n=1 Tax=Cyclobacterium marinum (strain ATCC 25205 / DSM 745 / LMG 13164 / NCIMB 1802) TaxID=880070 RepID=G0IVW8_CYCMS|nr:hypothetical protein Cycma_1759 [Cyclobacterium marinum DSM 745]